jgi:outer membrane protein OmpA-like peptidoglycan-associated protein
MRSALLTIAGLLLAGPALAQTVGPCPGNVGSAAVSKPSWVLFDLGSAVIKPEYKDTIVEAAKTAKARQATKVCVVGQTDKLGDKNYNAKLAQQRSQAVASELIKAGYPAKDVVIASTPEAFGNMSLGGNDASEKDRRVTIIPR